MEPLCSIHAGILLLLFLSITFQSCLGKGPAKLTVVVLLGFLFLPFFLELPKRNKQEIVPTAFKNLPLCKGVE